MARESDACYRSSFRALVTATPMRVPMERQSPRVGRTEGAKRSALGEAERITISQKKTGRGRM